MLNYYQFERQPRIAEARAMLDFYLIPDNQNPSSKGLILERVGGIEDELFFQLQHDGVIEPWFDCYSKFRWSSELAARKLLKLQQQLPTTSLQKERTAFKDILQKAVNAQCGLIAFGD